MKIDFNKMSNTEKIDFLVERNGYIEGFTYRIKDGIGVDDNGNEFRDDEGQALFINLEQIYANAS